MEKLQRKRATTHTKLEAKAAALQSLATAEAPRVVTLRRTLSEFDDLASIYLEVQSQIEADLAPELFEEDFANSQQKLSAVYECRDAAEERLLQLTKIEDSPPTPSENSVSSVRPAIKLPKLDLPKFRGNIVDFNAFWEQFSCSIDDSELSDVTKFSYLASLLEGDAKRVISGLSITGANYSIACDLLKNRFGDEERIISAHIQALVLIQSPQSSKGPKYVSQLWCMRDELNKHIKSLEALKISGKQYDRILTPIILSRLPDDLRLEWARRSEGHVSDLEFLMNFMESEIKCLERSETYKDLSLSKEKSEDKKSHSKVESDRSSAAALYSASSGESPICSFCDKNHRSEKCHTVTKLKGKERGIKIRDSGVCFYCLSKDHRSKGCKEYVRCTLCGKKHNTLMCGIRIEPFESTSTQSHRVEERSTSTEEKKTPSSEASKPKEETKPVSASTVSTNLKTVLETATGKVALGNGEDIPAKLMFDTGSDRVYISSEYVKRCNPKFIRKEWLPYSAFGGYQSKDLQTSMKFNCLVKKINLI